MRAVRRDAGVAGVAYMLGRRLGLPGVRLEWFVVYEHSRPSDPDVVFRWAGRDDLAALAAFDRGEDVVRTRLDRGDRVAVAEEDDAIAGWVWITPAGVYDEGGLMFHLGPGDAWAYDGMVDPALRGRGISPRLRRAVSADLREEGVGRLLSTVDRLNTPSHRASVRSGREVARFLQLQVGPRGLVRIAAAGRGARWHAYRGTLDVRVPPGS